MPTHRCHGQLPYPRDRFVHLCETLCLEIMTYYAGKLNIPGRFIIIKLKSRLENVFLHCPNTDKILVKRKKSPSPNSCHFHCLSMEKLNFINSSFTWKMRYVFLLLCCTHKSLMENAMGREMKQKNNIAAIIFKCSF